MIASQGSVVNSNIDSKTDKLQFNYYPGFARFLKENHLRDYVIDLLAASREMNLPILKFLTQFTEEQLIELGQAGHGDFLQHVADNNIRSLLETNLEKWKNDQLEILKKEEIAAEDITLGTFVRKKVQLKYIPLYTTDPYEIIAIVNEIELYESEATTSATNLYLDILREKIQTHSHFINQMAATTPGFSYVYSLETTRLLYANTNYEQFSQHTLAELTSMGPAALTELVHPDDLDNVNKLGIAARNIVNGEVLTAEYRLKNTSGDYHWVRNYTSVFKRAGDGSPLEVIGLILDIDTEKNTALELQESEAKLLEAQELADMGSFEIDIETGTVTVTQHFLKILETDKYDRAAILDRVHPADRERTAVAREEAIKNNAILDLEYRYLVNGKEKVLWSRGSLSERNGRRIMKGTVMDVTNKRHMIQKLERSEYLYKQAQAFSHMGNWTWDFVNGKLQWSDELYHIYELPVGTEIDSEYIATFNHPNDAQRVYDIVHNSFSNKDSYDFYYRIYTAKGVLKHLHAHGEVLTDEKGQIYKMLGTLQDVTERQQMLEQLQESDKLYKQAQAISLVGNWTWDIAANTISWSDELYRIFGMPPQSEEISLDKYVSFIHITDREKVTASIQASLQTKQSFENTYHAILEDGTKKIVHSKGELELDSNGAPVKMYGICQDVTLQKNIEKQARDNQEFIKKIADTTPSLIASYNVNTGNYTFVNKALQTILGYPAEEALQGGIQFFVSIVHPDDLEPLVERNTKAIEAYNNAPPADGVEPVLEFKYRMKHKKGHYLWFHTYGTIFDRNERGMIEHVLNVSIDITEQEEAGQVLHQKNLELQSSNTSLEEYAYVASHDLKEPMRKISTFGDRLLITQRDNLTEEGKLYLEKIMESSRRMQAMISDLLMVSTISGNKNFVPIDLNEVIREVLQTLEFKIEEKNATVTADELPTANVVPSQFRQLFQNLISNSLKFTKPGVPATIHISSRYVTSAEVAPYELAIAERYLQITLHDNGIGFDNQYANKIFTIFQRLHGKSEYEGTGIGLAICKKIAENHGGTIFANSKLNEGAIFTIIIPV